MATKELTEKGKRIAVRLGIVLLVIILAVVWLRIRNRDASNNPLGIGASVTPSGFTARLPYFGQGFSADYLTDEDTYIVNIYEEPVEEKKEEALRFLRKNGAKIPPSKVSYFLGAGTSDHVGP